MFANPMMLPFMLYRRWLGLLVLPWIGQKTVDPEVNNLPSTQSDVGQR